MTPPAPSLAAWYATSRWTQYQGHRVAYQNNGSESGSGAATVLIHGFPTASWDWHRVWPTLTSLGPLLAPDLLGFGYSAKPHPYPYSLRDQAQLILALCRQHNIKQVHVLAHDYGDSVAQELLALTQENRADDLEIQSVYLLNGA